MQQMKLSKEDVFEAILIHADIEVERSDKGEVTIINRPDFNCLHRIPYIPKNFSPHKISLDIPNNYIGVWRICDHKMTLPSYKVINVFTGDLQAKAIETPHSHNKEAKEEGEEEVAVAPPEPVKKKKKAKETPVTTPAPVKPAQGCIE